MKQIIAIAAVKGGVAKTATCGSLAEAAAGAGRRVLMIDLDPQAGLSIWYKGDLKQPGAYQTITGKCETAEAIQPVKPGLDLMAGEADTVALKTSPASATRLKNALQPVLRRYDFIFIDCGPAMNEALNNALMAATGVLIPLEADGGSLQAYFQTMDIIRQIQTTTGLTVKGVVITKYDSRPRVNRLLRDAIIQQCQADKSRYLGEIRQGVLIREAIATQTPLFDYAPHSKPAIDYLALYNKIKGAK